jgi:arylsulfatase
MHGVSMRYSFFDADADSLRRTQYFETWGNRGLWHDDWMAICRLQPDAPGAFPPLPITTAFDELAWELYDHRVDPTECHDLAASNPTKLRQLVDYWWAEAGRYDVLPIDIRPRAQRWPANPPRPAGSVADRTVFFGSSGPYERGVTPRIAGRSFSIDAEIVVRDNAAQGVIYALGSVHGGYCWYVLDRRMVFEVASSSIESESVAVPIELDPGPHSVRVDVAADVDLSGHVSFSIDGRDLGGANVRKLLRRMPIGSARTRVGAANGSPVSGAFEAPFAFRGELRRVTVVPRGGHPDNARAEHEAEMRDQ